MYCRTEHDLLGEKQVPGDVLWGIHTLRALENFRFTSQKVDIMLIYACAFVKKACSRANSELGFLDQKIASAIEIACDEIVDGKYDAQFPLDALQGGAGTSTNMNVNEVIANRALEIMGFQKGDYSHCHPIEHVNMHQSTNDVYPTALKIACIDLIRKLALSAESLQGAFQRKEKEFAAIVTIGRTEMQDAVPVTLGAQFSSFADAIARDRWRTFKCEERLRVVNLGGTAVGTGLAAPRRYIFLVIEKLRQLTGFGLTRGENVVDQTANADVFSEVSGILSAHASNIMKISRDLRMLHFTKEIVLPALQSGSSIMPGKINPVMAEAAIQAAIKVQANHQIISQCAGLGTLQINEFLPLIASSLLESIRVLTNVNTALASHVDGVKANRDECERGANGSITLITAFLPYIGYDKAQILVQEFHTSGEADFRAFLTGKLGADLVEKVLSPANLVALGYKDAGTNKKGIL